MFKKKTQLSLFYFMLSFVWCVFSVDPEMLSLLSDFNVFDVLKENAFLQTNRPFIRPLSQLTQTIFIKKSTGFTADVFYNGSTEGIYFASNGCGATLDTAINIQNLIFDDQNPLYIFVSGATRLKHVSADLIKSYLNNLIVQQHRFGIIMRGELSYKNILITGSLPLVYQAHHIKTTNKVVSEFLDIVTPLDVPNNNQQKPLLKHIVADHVGFGEAELLFAHIYHLKHGIVECGARITVPLKNHLVNGTCKVILIEGTLRFDIIRLGSY